MICLFQFEEELYKKAGIDASWVGHPLVDLAKPRFEKNEFLKIIGREKTKLTVCLMPGSRKKEVKNHLGLLLKTAQLMQRQYGNLQFVLVKSPNLDHPLYERYLRKLNLPLSLVNGQTYDCLNVCDLALVASGTATLECLLLEKPLLILYKVGFLSYLLGKFLVKIPYLGMVNVLAEKEICPEFIQARAKAKNLTQAAIRLLGNERLRKEMILEEFLVKAKLGKPGAVKRAAEIILHYL
jgi:lipid-A-disaccharide synthase